MGVRLWDTTMESIRHVWIPIKDVDPVEDDVEGHPDEVEPCNDDLCEDGSHLWHPPLVGAELALGLGSLFFLGGVSFFGKSLIQKFSVRFNVYSDLQKEYGLKKRTDEMQKEMDKAKGEVQGVLGELKKVEDDLMRVKDLIARHHGQ